MQDKPENAPDTLHCVLWDPTENRCRVDLSQMPLDHTLRGKLQILLSSLLSSFDIKLALLWSVDPINRNLILVGTKGISIRELGVPICDEAKYLSGLAVDSREIQFFPDIRENRPDGRAFVYLQQANKQGLGSMVSIPVLNVYNMQQVTFILDIFPEAWDTFSSRVLPARLGEVLAMGFDILLKDHCTRYANRLSIDAARGEARTPADIYKTAATTIRRAVSACVAGIFVERGGGTHLERECHAGRSLPRETYDKLHNRATECWRHNREELAFSVGEGRIKQYHELVLPDVEYALQSWLFVPVRDSRGHARGVFFCIRDSTDSGMSAFAPFAYEDVTVVEAIGQAFAAQLEILMADYRRMNSLDKLAHELRLPLTAMRAVIERIQRESKNLGVAWAHDYFRDAWFFSDVMNRLLFELDVIRKGPQSIPLEPTLTGFHGDVIAPAIRFLEPLLRRKGLSRTQVKYSGIMDNLPELYCDPWLMTHVVFNLIENAIKYCDKREKFNVEIEGHDTGSDYEIAFRDYGIGIPNGWEEKIFLQNVRGPNTEQYNVSGEGFGLWFAREIVNLHGGRLLLRSPRNPTEFVIVLPYALSNSKPSDGHIRLE